jgi:hypothetical protein
MIDEYNLVEGDEEFIDGSMDLGTESPLEMNEHKIVKKMNESQFRNYIYETVLNMLNEDGPMAAGGMPMDPAAAGGMPMDPAAAGGAPGGAPEDADKNSYKDRADKKKSEIAQKVKDTTGGAPGFNPKDEGDEKDKDDDKKDKKKDKDKKKHEDKEKKELAERIAKSVFNQILEEFGHK